MLESTREIKKNTYVQAPLQINEESLRNDPDSGVLKSFRAILMCSPGQESVNVGSLWEELKPVLRKHKENPSSWGIKCSRL